jgi:hypothetical protein
MSLEAIGCCGAYCGTCKAFSSGDCKGCKLGYADGTRNLSSAKCKIKICCIQKGFISCADCATYETCETIQDFHNHDGYKYGKYKLAIAYIRHSGYSAYLLATEEWTHAYGAIEKKKKHN